MHLSVSYSTEWPEIPDIIAPDFLRFGDPIE